MNYFRFAEKQARGRKKKISTPAGKSVGLPDFCDSDLERDESEFEIDEPQQEEIAEPQLEKIDEPQLEDQSSSTSTSSSDTECSSSDESSQEEGGYQYSTYLLR